MVLQKRLEYGFNGYQVPPTPRATRSARRRVPFRKKVDDDQMSAFDLLATVAGKLLLEGDKTPSSTEILSAKENCAVGKDSVKKELAEDNPDKIKVCDEGSCGRNFFLSEIVSQAPGVKHSVKELSHAQNDACSALASVVTNSDCSEKFSSTAKLVNGEQKIEHGNSSTTADVEFYRKSLSFGSKLDYKSKKHIKIEPPMIGKETIDARADMFCSEDPVVCDVKPPAPVSFDTSIKLPVKPSFLNENPRKNLRDQNPSGSFPACRDNVKLVSRDDDENSFGCTQPSTLNEAFRQPPRVGGRRIRRLLASKYWKATPKLKDEERFGTETKAVYHNRVYCCKRQRSLRDYPFKKRRLHDRSFLTNADERVNSDDTSSSPGKGSSEDASGSVSTMHEAIGASAFTAGQQTSFQQRDSHVKLKIKSFRVPELFIEIPETATVGSLKRTVMEAVTAIFSGGLRVGLVLQGKKIRDDNKTLVQMGISGNNKIDALGFTLEPNSSQAPPHLCPEDYSFILPSDTPQPLIRCSRAPIVVQQGISDVSQDTPIANFGNVIESDHDSVPSPPDMSTEKSMTDSRALVAVPEMNVEALAVVPMQKSKRLDVGQRRIRRPFSVSEVEALVQAVEKLGTGRWRDVKLQAFDSAKHRTYVDLKDKWKTLVHTARISPQQRRGEPVPQEFLDRVLAAHAFWSQQQAKQQLKQHSEACLLF